jgi:hypothetical protein
VYTSHRCIRHLGNIVTRHLSNILTGQVTGILSVSLMQHQQGLGITKENPDFRVHVGPQPVGKVVATSPWLVGENLNNEFNRELEELAQIVEALAVERVDNSSDSGMIVE